MKTEKYTITVLDSLKERLASTISNYDAEAEERIMKKTVRALLRYRNTVWGMTAKTLSIGESVELYGIKIVRNW